MSVAGFVTVCRKGNLPQVEALLRQNPHLNVNVKNEKGRTGLMMAAYEGRAQVAEALLRKPGVMRLEIEIGHIYSITFSSKKKLKSILLLHPKVST